MKYATSIAMVGERICNTHIYSCVFNIRISLVNEDPYLHDNVAGTSHKCTSR